MTAAGDTAYTNDLGRKYDLSEAEKGYVQIAMEDFPQSEKGADQKVIVDSEVDKGEPKNLIDLPTPDNVDAMNIFDFDEGEMYTQNSITITHSSDNESRPSTGNSTFSKLEIIYITQIFALLAVIITSLVNLSLQNEPMNLWIVFLSSGIGSLLPGPKAVKTVIKNKTNDKKSSE